MNADRYPGPIMAVRNEVHGTTGEWLARVVWVWCPGCAEPHRFRLAAEDGTQPPAGPVWTWDGNTEAPTFEASMLVNAGHAHPGAPVCHSFLRAGRWEFLGDSTHALAGQTVDMVPLPVWLAKSFGLTGD